LHTKRIMGSDGARANAAVANSTLQRIACGA
jgi:hypothetical protein